MTKLEKEFIASLEALLIRYKVDVERGISGLDEGCEIEWTFSNNSKLAKDEIFLTMDEIHKEILRGKQNGI